MSKAATISESFVRPWSDTERRLPFWLRGHNLPKRVAEPVERAFYEHDFPEPLASLRALLTLGQAAEGAILIVRRDHNSNLEAMAPGVFVQNVVFMMRSGRDEILRNTPQANVPVVNARLERLIDAIKATLDAFMSAPLEQIWCANPSCNKRGRHLLPGPWQQASERFNDAREDAFRLVTFYANQASDDNDLDKEALLNAPGVDKMTDATLSKNDAIVLKTMARFDASRLLSLEAIAAAMEVRVRLSERTIGPIVRKLIGLNLAERPDGSRSGARLNRAGRRLASKFAD